MPIRELRQSPVSPHAPTRYMDRWLETSLERRFCVQVDRYEIKEFDEPGGPLVPGAAHIRVAANELIEVVRDLSLCISPSNPSALSSRCPVADHWSVLRVALEGFEEIRAELVRSVLGSRKATPVESTLAEHFMTFCTACGADTVAYQPAPYRVNFEYGGMDSAPMDQAPSFSCFRCGDVTVPSSVDTHWACPFCATMAPLQAQFCGGCGQSLSPPSQRQGAGEFTHSDACFRRFRNRGGAATPLLVRIQLARLLPSARDLSVWWVWHIENNLEWDPELIRMMDEDPELDPYGHAARGMRSTFLRILRGIGEIKAVRDRILGCHS
jgi:hypothetical protein